MAKLTSVLAGATAAALLASQVWVSGIARAAPPDPNAWKHRTTKTLPPRIPLYMIAILKPSVVSSELSVYVTPFSSWCAAHPRDTLEGRVHLQLDYRRQADGTQVPAYLIVDNGMSGGYRQAVSLGAGRFSLSSNSFRMPASAVCSDRCVDYRLVARDPADAKRVNIGPYRACVR
ncbi:MAG TPA: hypothetical protein VKA50_02275 [Gammaproteobacteria bacterium]|nr:hypothetical protein [Gammaproteobacteria bacterium]